MATRRITIAIVTAIAVFSAACTSSAVESTTTVTAASTTVPSEIPDLEFGSGEVPFTVPADFPIPDTGVIGTTMIDGVNGRSEMNVNIPGAVSDVVRYYETNLPALGFAITDSKGSESEWNISLTKGGVTATIRLAFGAPGLTTATFSFNHA